MPYPLTSSARRLYAPRIDAAKEVVRRLVSVRAPTRSVLTPQLVPTPRARPARVRALATYWDNYLYSGLDEPAQRGAAADSTPETEAGSGGDPETQAQSLPDSDRADGIADADGDDPIVAPAPPADATQIPVQKKDSKRGADDGDNKRTSQNERDTSSATSLQSDQTRRDALSSELLRMASVLKQNSAAFTDALERDRILVEQAGERLGQNLDLLTRTRGKLGVFSKKARSMGWLTLGSIAAVLISWIAMFVVIKLT